MIDLDKMVSLETDKRDLQAKMKKLKKRYAADLKAIRDRQADQEERLRTTREGQLGALNRRIEALKAEEARLNNSVGAMQAYRELCAKMRKELNSLAFDMQEVFETYPIPSEYQDDLKKIAREMINGGEAMIRFIDGKAIGA